MDPEILRLEHEFKLSQRGGLSQVQISNEESEDGEEEDDNISSQSDDTSPLRSVASIDSIQENADFVHVE